MGGAERINSVLRNGSRRTDHQALSRRLYNRLGDFAQRINLKDALYLR